MWVLRFDIDTFTEGLQFSSENLIGALKAKSF